METLPNELHHKIVGHISEATIIPMKSVASEEQILALLHLSQADKHWHAIAAPVLKRSLSDLIKAVRKASWRNRTETQESIPWLMESDIYLRRIVMLPHCLRRWVLSETLSDHPIELKQSATIPHNLDFPSEPEKIDTEIDGGRSTAIQAKIDCPETRTFLAKGLELSGSDDLFPGLSALLMDPSETQVVWTSQVKLIGQGGVIKGRRYDRGDKDLGSDTSLDTWHATWWKDEDGAITLFVRLESDGKSQ